VSSINELVFAALGLPENIWASSFQSYCLDNSYSWFARIYDDNGDEVVDPRWRCEEYTRRGNFGVGSSTDPGEWPKNETI
jgi:hypothetical protein